MAIVELSIANERFEQKWFLKTFINVMGDYHWYVTRFSEKVTS
jgi:hypothetical protein